MTNVKLEMVCEFKGKRYRFVENTYKEFGEYEHCKRRCALWNKVCPKIIMTWNTFNICSGVKYGHWEEIK